MPARQSTPEDSPDDVELMLRRLREAGIEPQWDRVESAAALREALAVLAEAARDEPAPTVSGAITEDTTVATLTAGAAAVAHGGRAQHHARPRQRLQ